MSKVVIDELRCKGCALCTVACPRGLLHLSDKLNRLGYLPAQLPPEREGECTSCALCAQVCPDVAIAVWRESKKPA